MALINIAQPDITLLLDSEGRIREATLANTLVEGGLDGWIGRPWSETVADAGDTKVTRMIEDARTNQVSVFRQLTQRFPSGRELLMEYTTVRLGGNAGLLAIGKNLQAVAELQSRLVSAQQAMERDYWKLREVETRYRHLFTNSNEAAVMVRASDLRVVDANPAAVQALDISSEGPSGVNGRKLLSLAAENERERLRATLSRVREQGTAPAFLGHFGANRDAWMVRASLMASEPGPLFLLQLTPAGATRGHRADNGSPSVDDLLERVPDGFVILDQDGVVVKANRAFLDLIEVGAEGSVIGKRLGRWLRRPGADQTVLLATVRRHGLVRLFSTTISGEVGTETEVEISAAADSDKDFRFLGALIRNVGRRLATTSANGDGLGTSFEALSEQIGKTTLRKLVKNTVGVIEKHYVEAALDLTGGNRTAAAELLGLSRQSLYAKLNRYSLDGWEPEAGAPS